MLTERPARIKAIVSNPELGSVEFRECEAFQNTVHALREALER